MGSRISEKDALERDFALGVKRLTPYHGSREQHEYICPRCNKSWLTTPADVWSGKTGGHRSCEGHIQDFNIRLKNKGFQLLEDYVNWNHKTKIQCHCGNIFTSSIGNALNKTVKGCGCVLKNQAIENGKKRQKYKDYNDISGQYLYTVEKNAKARKIDFSVSIEYLYELYKEQNGKCALSGLKIFHKKKQMDTFATASLDRIDSSKGYIVGNVQWIHKTINQMKWNSSQEEFIEFCKAVAAHNQESTCQTNFQEA